MWGRVVRVFEQHVKAWLKWREQQPGERLRSWCLCGQRIKHEGLCWVRRADLVHRRKARA